MLRAIKELYKYRNLVGYLIKLDLKLRYRGSVLGFLWTLLNPLLLMLVMAAVFSRFGRIEEKNYALFLLAGLMIWMFFQQSVEAGLAAILRQRSLLQKIYVPKVIFPVTVVSSNLVNLAFFLVAYLVIAAFSSVGLLPTIPLVLPVLVMVYLISLGGALVMSTLNVFFRDFTHLTGAILRAGFYVTPILYSPTMFGDEAHFFLRLNPMYYPVVAARDVIYYGVVPGPDVWAIGFATGFAILAVGLLVFVANQTKLIYYA
ncbi:ABC transporter permease [Myxococcota bacterium]